ncbi:hypothetical protein B0I35DRAFT_403514 [Stachybotrys elegans]|uniref:DUF7704 domain-containing protein n=1 Tax=Stachybotrys elegans TaxID=80388 RepID=A0A8K0T054_9HYPO|nr:hypothetical protein B0I35DRAFT_403514 [Stachybotrys elegans]
MAQPVIHPLYRFWFKWLDPFTLLFAVYGLIFTPELVLDVFIPASLSTYNRDQGFLFHQLAALYAFVGIMLGGMLRVSHELKAWRLVVAAVLLVDIGILSSIYISLKEQNRMHMEAIRPEELGNILFTAFIAILRVSFLAGVGVQDAPKQKSA